MKGEGVAFTVQNSTMNMSLSITLGNIMSADNTSVVPTI
jgi:hypothetical protein